jgi:hypothetical protein
VLQGLTAPATQANVSDLDEWQAAEGGSTNNTAAYNPFNTGRMIDASGAPIPGAVSANGFPAFANWPDGCAATVATLFQPNMWSITSALRAGDVAPPGAFLAVVDQSAWCAPSAGVPCYTSSILGAAATLPTVPAHSSALDVYGNVKSDLRSFEQALAAVTADQGVVLTRDQQLAAAEAQVSTARSQYDAAIRALKKFAIEEYVSSGLYAEATLTPGNSATPYGPQTAEGVTEQQYLGIAATNLLARTQMAAAAEKASITGRASAIRAVSQATSTLASDEAAERQSLTELVDDVATLQNAGACTSVTIVAPATSTSGKSNTSTTSTTTTTTLPSTTTTVPSTSTTTTTVPSTSTTTTTVPSTSTTTTTVPSTTTSVPSTTTTTVPTSVPTTTVPSSVPTTTTTTTLPKGAATNTTTTTTTSARGTPSAAGPASANPAGVAALQGCLGALAPPGSA